MKIAFCIEDFEGAGTMSKFFGTSEYFLVYDAYKKQMTEKLTNHLKNSSASDILCAQVLINRGINIVVCGEYEENSKKLFSEAKIEMFEGVNTTPKIFLKKYHTINQ